MWKKLAIGMVAVVAALILTFCVIPLKTVAYTIDESYQEMETYYEKEPYTEQEAYVDQLLYQSTEEYYTTQNMNYTLWNDTSFDVSARTYRYYNYYIDIANRQSNFVTGSVKSISGVSINFFIFDQKNFYAWRDSQNYQPYLSGNVTEYDFTFVPDHTDYFYFVFDNGFSSFGSKLIQFSSDWTCLETVKKTRQVTKYQPVTKYRDVVRYKDVAKQREVTKTRPVTKSKQVSLLEFLTRY